MADEDDTQSCDDEEIDTGKEKSFNLYDKELSKLFETVVNLSEHFDVEDDNFIACMEFFKFTNNNLQDIKDKSTGRGHAIPSKEAIEIFGPRYSQLMYMCLNKLTAYCTSKYILPHISVFVHPK